MVLKKVGRCRDKWGGVDKSEVLFIEASGVEGSGVVLI